MKQLKKIGGVLGGLLLAIAHTHAAGTSAGDIISNQASVSYNAGAGTVTADSGVVTFKVQELVKGTIEKLDVGNVNISSPQLGAAMKFKIKNDGNGDEAFKIAVTQDSGDDFDVILSTFYVDNGDGIFDILTDTIYNNAAPPSIAADGDITVWVTSNIPASLADASLANLNVSAVSTTFVNAGNDNPSAGDVVTGNGDDNTDAINAVAITSVTSTFVVSDIDVAIAKAITATRDNLGAGGNNAVPGAEVDYTLTVTVTGTGSANSIIVTDPLPDELALKDGISGTIIVGGIAETATNGDSDGTSYDANTNTVTVNLGNVNAGDPAIAIQFTTVIQ